MLSSRRQGIEKNSTATQRGLEEGEKVGLMDSKRKITITITDGGLEFSYYVTAEVADIIEKICEVIEA
jgi:hypothetical protein